MGFSCARRQFGASSLRNRKTQNESAPREPSGDELRELSETFQQTVGRLSSLVTELEEAHRQTLQAEQDKKRFYREVIRAVTLGKFELVDEQEIPQPGARVAELPVADGKGYAAARKAIRAAAEEAGLSEDQGADLLLAAGEAITNAMKHATAGICTLYRSDEGLFIRVKDSGGGIRSTNLPAAILMPGFSTKVSLGMGYTMMLKLCDRVWLSTGPEGTTVLLEKLREPRTPANPLEAAAFNGL